MRDERPVVVDCCRALLAKARDLESAIAGLSPSDLGSRWWAGDPDANPPLRKVALDLENCMAQFNALQVALELPAEQSPRYRQFVEALGRDCQAPRARIEASDLPEPTPRPPAPPNRIPEGPARV